MNLFPLALLAGLGYLAYKATSEDKPAAPSKPSTPTGGVPSVPSVPSVPGVPGVPSVPSGSGPSLPWGLPGVPSLPSDIVPIPIPGTTPGAPPTAPPSSFPGVPSEVSPWYKCHVGVPLGADALTNLKALAVTCAAGMLQMGDPTILDANNDTQTFAVPLDAGNYRFIAVGGKGLTEVNLFIQSTDGIELAADRTPNDIVAVVQPGNGPSQGLVRLAGDKTVLLVVESKGKGQVALGAYKQPMFLGV